MLIKLKRFSAPAIQRIARIRLQLHRTADIAGHHFFRIDGWPRTCVNLRNAFFRTRSALVKSSSCTLHAHHLEILHVTDMRPQRSLEEIQGSRSVESGSPLAACIVPAAFRLQTEQHYPGTPSNGAHPCPFPHTNRNTQEKPTPCGYLTHFVFIRGPVPKKISPLKFHRVGSLYQCFMHGSRFFHFRGNIFYSGRSAFRPPRIFFISTSIND